MGQRYVPELHDPESRTPEGQGEVLLTDDEINRKFEAIIVMLDAGTKAELNDQQG